MFDNWKRYDRGNRSSSCTVIDSRSTWSKSVDRPMENTVFHPTNKTMFVHVTPPPSLEFASFSPTKAYVKHTLWTWHFFYDSWSVRNGRTTGGDARTRKLEDRGRTSRATKTRTTDVFSQVVTRQHCFAQYSIVLRPLIIAFVRPYTMPREWEGGTHAHRPARRIFFITVYGQYGVCIRRVEHAANGPHTALDFFSRLIAVQKKLSFHFVIEKIYFFIPTLTVNLTVRLIMNKVHWSYTWSNIFMCIVVVLLVLVFIYTLYKIHKVYLYRVF